MFRLTKDLQSPKSIDCDVCIIGAGAAGIILASELIGSGQRVVVVEAGGMSPDPSTQELYAGEWSVSGWGNHLQTDGIIEISRLSTFGGSTQHWGGFCSTLDEIDFKAREWVPHSGWPFDRDHLEPYYTRAAKYFRIKPISKDVAAPVGSERQPLQFGGGPTLQSKMFHHSPERKQFHKWHLPALEGAPDVAIYLNTILTHIQVSENGKSIRHIKARTQEGDTVTIQSKRFVLACGGIENARLLLLANDIHKAGIGNDRDLVGRYFMGHLHMNSARLVTLYLHGLEKSEIEFYQTRFDSHLEHTSTGVLELSADLQAQFKVLNCTVWIGTWSNTRKKLSVFDDHVVAGSNRLFSTLRNQWATGKDLRTRFIALVAEQAPNRESRVTLLDSRDRLGRQKAKVDARFSELDYKTFEETALAIGREFTRAQIGRVQTKIEKEKLFEDIQPVLGYHHMGTTRMHNSLQDGVVNADCRVHGLSNLYIAGSSVFPTGGAVNPTFTIGALTVRLADHLKA